MLAQCCPTTLKPNFASYSFLQELFLLTLLLWNMFLNYFPLLAGPIPSFHVLVQYLLALPALSHLDNLVSLLVSGLFNCFLCFVVCTAHNHLYSPPIPSSITHDVIVFPVLPRKLLHQTLGTYYMQTPKSHFENAGRFFCNLSQLTGPHNAFWQTLCQVFKITRKGQTSALSLPHPQLLNWKVNRLI